MTNFNTSINNFKDSAEIKIKSRTAAFKWRSAAPFSRTTKMPKNPIEINKICRWLASLKNEPDY